MTPPTSYWIASTPDPDFPPLAGELEVDVAVVGAGIAGVTAATLVKRAGATVAVVEAKRILHGTTGYTTAKVTSGHGVVYTHLERHFGREGARLYAEANEAAIEQIGRFVAGDGIECDFERTENYVYAESEQEAETLRREAEAARRAGLPASFVRETELPLPVAGAVRLDRQAQFHPRRYLVPLAQRIPGDGSHLRDETRVLAVHDGEPCRVETDGGIVRARAVLLCTHLPILDRGLFFARAFPRRSYVVAAPVDAGPRGMYINIGSPTRSVRSTPHEGGRLLLVGGEGHKPGTVRDTEERYGRLEEWLRGHFQAGEIAYRWSTQDYTSVDRVPFVGKLRSGGTRIFVATGFGGWGMTGGTVAGMILADLALGRSNRWAALYDAQRVKVAAAARTFVKENADAARHWVADRRGTRPDAVAQLAPGDGLVARAGGELLAVHRDDAGRLHTVSAVCTHLGCIVGWNRAERTWDCPCHGSRFAVDGRVIEGPAVEDLAPRDAPRG